MIAIGGGITNTISSGITNTIGGRIAIAINGGIAIASGSEGEVVELRIEGIEN